MEINEAKDRQYAAAFTSVNAPNVKNQNKVGLQQPFQQQPELPLGQPPVRYPDVTTMGGFLENPQESANDVRSMAVRSAEAEERNREGPFPMEIDNEALVGPKAPPGYYTLGTENLSKEELFERAFKPRVPQNTPMLLW